MTQQKIRPCPNCKTDDYIAMYQYESGCWHVECDQCYYLGPYSGNRRQAIKLHNQRCLAQSSTEDMEDGYAIELVH